MPVQKPATHSTHAFAGPRPDIETLVTAYYPYIRRLAHAILDDAHEADDAAQETFLAANRALESYRGEAEPRTWLTSIAVNICRSRLRKRKVRRSLQAALEALHLLAPAALSPEAAAVQQEADRALWQAVEALDEKHRLVVVLRYVNELSTAEIAQILGTSEGTIHSRLHYARHKLQGRLAASLSYEEAPDGSS